MRNLRCLNLQGVPKNWLIKKSLPKLGAVGQNFCPWTWLGSAWSCLVLVRNDQKNIFPDTGGAGYWWFSSLCTVIPAVNFLGHPVCNSQFTNVYLQLLKSCKTLETCNCVPHINQLAKQSHYFKNPVTELVNLYWDKHWHLTPIET